MFFICLLTLVLWRCGADKVKEQKQEATALPYLGLREDATYVGMETCRECHASIYESFMRTGMGQSFGVATKAKSSADFSGSAIYDKWRDFHYKAFWRGDSMYISEFRSEGKDTLHMRTEHVSYVVGSGQHTNSHIMESGGYLTQLPMTYYTQEGRWDLPPGFENGNNSRFDRKIGLECMSCHNGYPEFEKGSENKYRKVMKGVDCERCHGPASFHVAEKKKGVVVDIRTETDYSIVNPAKLPAKLQIDVCQRCHLQGNAVLAEGKSFFDFRPGMPLSDVMHVFVARYEHDDSFIMASHADRLSQSACFAAGQGKGNKKHALTCVNCHNPHVSVKETGREIFNATCKGCHEQSDDHVKQVGKDDCVSCHMPRSGSSDIPHVVITDHRIQIPAGPKGEKEVVKGRFLGLACVNNPVTDKMTLANAYLNHFEKFEPLPFLLDSARDLLKGPVDKMRFRLLVKHHFLAEDYAGIKRLVRGLDSLTVINWLKEKSYSNDDAWTAYRIGEGFRQSPDPDNVLKDFLTAKKYFGIAVNLAPLVMDFRNKLGVALLLTGDAAAAFEVFAGITAEDPNFMSAWSNLGYLNLSKRGDVATAKRYYEKARKLNPDDAALLMNIVGMHIYERDFASARKLLAEILKKYPGHSQAETVLQSLAAYEKNP